MIGRMAKKERKNTNCPDGTPSEALSRLDIPRNTQTELSLNAIPVMAF